MYRSAVQSFQNAIVATEENGSDPEIRDLGYLALARIAYDSEQHDAAIYYYRKIPKGSYKRATAFYESAWVYFVKGDYSRALGTFQTLHSPYFEHQFYPELWILEATVYMNTCRFGDAEESLDGQTVVTHPDLDYQDMADLGPEFLAKLQYKTYPAEILRHLTLIDSPGMIDSASGSQLRGYDFRECVRRFAESADLILFFFDPDKPGTTGEAISIFTEQLVGLEHKLLIVLNKVDLFDHIRDFARTYGTLCWNLSKTIPTKDTPRIYTTYIPDLGTGDVDQKNTIPLGDFDASREEIIAEIKRAPARRANNLVSGLLIQTMTMARGKLARSQTHRNTHGIIWNGIGRKQHREPIQVACDTDLRVMCQRRVSNSR